MADPVRKAELQAMTNLEYGFFKMALVDEQVSKYEGMLTAAQYSY
jgi:hypothetical protein